MRNYSLVSIRSFFSILLVVLAACVPPTAPPPPTATVPAPASMDWIAIHFTDPYAPGARDYEGGPDEALAEAIDSAVLTVDVAVYSFNLWSIRNALLRAYHRGVVVRMVIESDNRNRDEVQALIEAGIPVLGDRMEGLMHDKFVVIDRAEVWIGSMNFTTGGAYRDDNNLVRIRSIQMAENYTHEFDEMFIGDHFGSDIVPDTPHPDLTINGTRIQTLFSPDDGVAAYLLELIHNAQESIHFMAFSFTSDELGEAIRERAQTGILVSGVMEAEQVRSNQGTEYDPFLQAGLDIRLDGNSDLMHHKVIIIDRSIVVTGSYNFSRNAEENNDENVVIIYSPEVAIIYLVEFQRVYERSNE